MEQNNGTQVITRRTKTQILELLKAYEKNHALTVKAFCEISPNTEEKIETAMNRNKEQYCNDKHTHPCLYRLLYFMG